MATATQTWLGSSATTAVGRVYKNDGPAYSRTNGMDDHGAYAEQIDSNNITRGFRQINLTGLAIPTDATVVSASLSRTILDLTPGLEYRLVGAADLAVNISSSDEDLFNTFTSGDNYQDSPSTEASGVLVTSMNAAGIADLQTRVSAGAATFLIGLRVDEAESGYIQEDWESSAVFEIEYTAAASSDIATINGVARASIATVNGVALASVGSVNGVA